MRGRDKFQKYKFIINFLSSLFSILPRGIRKKIYELFRRKQGNIGILIRYCLLKTLAKELGENVLIAPDVYIFCPERIEFGSNISIHPMSYIDGTGGLKVGNDVSIAHGATIMTTSHEYRNTLIPIKDQGVVCKNVTICDDVWIASKSTITAGRTVSSGTVIAANAVVTKDFPINSVLAGVPAKRIYCRDEIENT